jgi:hypothetical protein
VSHRFPDPAISQDRVQAPSLGRIVLYQRHGSPNGQHKSEPSPAIVTQVHPVREGAEVSEVDLCVFNPNGMYWNEATAYDADGAPGTWRWPPRS